VLKWPESVPPLAYAGLLWLVAKKNLIALREFVFVFFGLASWMVGPLSPAPLFLVQGRIEILLVFSGVGTHPFPGLANPPVHSGLINCQ